MVSLPNHVMYMAVREFHDDAGRGWRVWPVTPDNIHPATKSADYVDPIYQTGWLVFASVLGDEKRRLSPYSQRWANASDVELRAMLASAESVQGPRTDAQRSIDGEATPWQAPPTSVRSAEQLADVTAPQLVRTFRYPGGRYWTASVVVRPEDSDRPALRFTAGARIIELGTWPKEWADYTDEQLVELLRWAAPRLGTEALQPGVPRRRWDDRPEPGR